MKSLLFLRALWQMLENINRVLVWILLHRLHKAHLPHAHFGDISIVITKKM